MFSTAYHGERMRQSLPEENTSINKELEYSDTITTEVWLRYNGSAREASHSACSVRKEPIASDAVTGLPPSLIKTPANLKTLGTHVFSPGQSDNTEFSILSDSFQMS